MSDQPWPVTVEDITIGGRTREEQERMIADLQALEAARQARAQFVAETAAAARTALTWNAEIRATNASLQAAIDGFLADTPPADPAAQVVFLYQKLRNVAAALSTIATSQDRITREADGLIRLFGAVIPALSDLLDAH